LTKVVEDVEALEAESWLVAFFLVEVFVEFLGGVIVVLHSWLLAVLLDVMLSAVAMSFVVKNRNEK
jgi:hypothetical protein